MTLGIVSIAIAGLALAWSIVQGIRNSRALEREEKRREQEIILLQEQIATTMAARETQGAAVLTGYSRGVTTSGDDLHETFHVRNVGRAGARDVLVWVALRTPDVLPSKAPALTGVAELGALAPNDPAVGFTLTQHGPFKSEHLNLGAHLVASWTDDNGPHIEAIGDAKALLPVEGPADPRAELGRQLLEKRNKRLENGGLNWRES